MQEKISVIVPIYKVEKYIRKCLDSILQQTYTNLEIILVDDGSVDQCPQICDEYAQKDSRVVVIHKGNEGLSATRNAGLDIASGEYIGFVDSDDTIHPEMYEKLLTVIKSNSAQLAICNYEYVDETGNMIPKYSPIKSEVLSRKQVLQKLPEPYSTYYVTVWNKLYKKELFSSIRFPKGKIHEDQFIIHEILDSCQQIVIIEDKLYYYVQREGSITATELNVNRLDELEAFCNRLIFFHQKGYMEFKAPLADYLMNRYLWGPRCLIYPTNSKEQKRIKEIDAMVLETYRFGKQNISVKDRYILSYPNVYFKLRRIKEQIHIKHRILSIIEKLKQSRK